MFGKLLAVKPLLWIAGILLAANLAQFGVGIVRTSALKGDLAIVTAERDAAITNLAAADNARAAAVAANVSQKATVEELAARLDTAITENEGLDRLLTDANNTLRLVQRQRAEAIAKLEAEREKDYALDPSCGAWGAAAVCGRITGGLLDQWRGTQAAGRGDGNAAGGGAAPATGAGERGDDGDSAAGAGAGPGGPGG
jgi:hypothetical protein